MLDLRLPLNGNYSSSFDVSPNNLHYVKQRPKLEIRAFFRYLSWLIPFALSLRYNDERPITTIYCKLFWVPIMYIMSPCVRISIFGRFLPFSAISVLTIDVICPPAVDKIGFLAKKHDLALAPFFFGFCGVKNSQALGNLLSR